MQTSSFLTRRAPFGIVALAAIALAGVLSSPVAAGPPATMQVISRDPYTNPDTHHASEVEPSSFAFGNTIVAAFQAGRAPNGGASNIGWARSDDGGVTWSRGFLPGITLVAGGTYQRATDSVVAYDALHDVWMISYVAFNVPGGLVGPPAAVMVSRSTDGGVTWGSPIAMDEQFTPTIADKNWTVCDNHPASPYYGQCYTQYSAPSPTPDGYPLTMTMRTSTDGGLTWGPAKTVDGTQYGGGGQPVVQPDGNVVVPFEQLSATNGSFDAMAAFRSTDGGDTWHDTSEIAAVHMYNRSQNDIRSGVLPSAAVDDSGRVFVVWNDCRFEKNCSANDVVLTTSANGVDWTPIKRVPVNERNSGRSQMLPAIAVEPGTSGAGAHLSIVTYFIQDANCPTAKCKVKAVYLSSDDGGNTWSSKTRLGDPMNLTWFPLTGPGYMFGDYYSISYAPGGVAVPVLPLARKPSGATLNVPMFSTRI